MAGVELKQLHRRFGDVVALAGIDLESRAASSSRCSGRPGAARRPRCGSSPASTGPTSGRVLIDGKDMTGVPPNRRDIGMVFQAYSLFPNMTAERNVEFGLRVRKEERGDRKAGRSSCSSSSASARPPTAIRTSSPAACSSASRSPARWRSSRGCCCSTSRSRRSTRRCACSCARRSAASSRARDHDDLRHARPGGGALDLRPRGGALVRADRADRDAGRDLRRARDAVRRRVHRHDEPARVERVDPSAGWSSTSGPRSPVDAARGRPRGERVLCSCDPRRSRSSRARIERENGARGRGRLADLPRLGHARAGRCAGANEWTADLSAERPRALPVGAR